MQDRNQRTVIIMVGLSGSGKSTWARDYCRKHENWVIVSRDAFRYMLKNSPVVEPKIEDMINSLVETAIMKALKYKCNVIVDNTHIRAHRINEIIDLVKYSADVKFMLFDLPAKKCIENDAKRDRQVGEHVILAQNDDFKVLKDSFVFQDLKQRPIWERPRAIPNFNSKLPNSVIFDMDGTLSFIRNRGPYEAEKVDRDDPNEVVIQQVKFYKGLGYKILIVSGREEISRKPTTEWLDFYGVEFDELYMRPKDDFRPDSKIKHEIYINQIKDNYNVICVFDDRKQVVDKWRELGLFVFDCNQLGIEF